MTQLDFFSEQKSKTHSMAFAAQGHEPELEAARDMAVKLIALRGAVTIDDLRAAMPKMQWGNWADSIFKDDRFICLGFTQARHKNSHARIIHKWGIKK